MKNKLLFKAVMILCSAMSVCSETIAKELPGQNFQDGQWVKMFSYISEPSSQLGPAPFSNLSIYVPNNSVMSKTVWAVYTKSDITHFISSESTTVKTLKIPRYKYFSLLDLASKEVGAWELFTYHKLGLCHIPKKQIVFNGKTQSILSICGYSTELPRVSKRMLRLSNVLEALLNEVEEDGGVLPPDGDIGIL